MFNDLQQRQQYFGDIRQHINTIRAYQRYYQAQLGLFARWIKQQIAPLKNAIIGFIYWIKNGIVRALLRMINAIRYEALATLVWMMGKILDGFIRGYRFVLEMIINGFNLLGRFLCAIGNALLEIPKAIYYALVFIKDVFVFVLENLADISMRILRDLFSLAKWGVKKAGKQLWLMIGFVMGISAAFVDIGGEMLNFLSSSIGLDLAQYAAFEAIKWGLTLALSAAAVYGISQFSWMGFAGLLIASQFMRLLPNPPAVPEYLNENENGLEQRPNDNIYLQRDRVLAPQYQARRDQRQKEDGYAVGFGYDNDAKACLR